MAWITINEDECPRCQRRGDHGDRKNGLCWRCNLPDELDPNKHGHLLSTLGWERDNLLHTQADIDTLPDSSFEQAYGSPKAYARPIVARMLERNARDIKAIEDGAESDQLS